MELQINHNKESMSVLTGIIVDVSGSMKRSISGKANGKGGSWARSIFNVVDKLIKHDVSSSNNVFAIGVGARKQETPLDLLNTVKKASPPYKESIRSKRDLLEETLTILENSGAPRVRTWAKMHVLLDCVKYSEVAMVLHMLKSEGSDFKRRFVFECLPEECREVKVTPANTTFGSGFGIAAGYFLGAATGPVGLLAASLIGAAVGAAGKHVKEKTKENYFEDQNANYQHQKTEREIREAIDKGMELAKDALDILNVSVMSVIPVQEAWDILHDCKGEEELTDKRVDELMETVEPHIYGRTPLMQAMMQSTELFAMSRFQRHDKLLFILSDGLPTDGYNPPLRELSELGVKIVCCYITDRNIFDPRRLYSIENVEWDDGAKFMFRMSSTITTQNIPRTIFVKRGWTVDITNNETRLFCQVNHPDTIDDVCDLARNVVCSQDALADALASVTLDVYVNKCNPKEDPRALTGFAAQRQEDGTCYANASAAVMHLSMHRIVGREGGYPEFIDLRDKIITGYGKDGANTLQVLQAFCPKCRLQCKNLGNDVLAAMKAITEKRPVVARFRLTEPEWELFSAFYRANPRGILSRSDLDIRQRWHGAELGGHAVVLTSYNSDGLRLMNSWGSEFADDGFFRVSSADVLGLEFIDVFWTLDNLWQSERDAFARYGAKKADEFMGKLRGLQQAAFRCPSCYNEAKVTQYSGNHSRVQCPCCRRSFQTKDGGEDLALNLYLTSLSYHDKK
ncbi:unnamed protein product [Owenia fusiformis]|nr:unnamed protein product [Owenia fusiformis]